jgi:hypothetical protein
MELFIIKTKGKALDLGLRGVLPIKQEVDENGRITYYYENTKEFGKILKQVDVEYKKRKLQLKQM